MARRLLVFDASPLNHFARAAELETLRDLVKGSDCVTTKAVQGELREGAKRHRAIDAAIDLDWIEVVPCDELDELYLFGQYMNRLGNLRRNAGGRPCSPGLRRTQPPPTWTIRSPATSPGVAAFGSTEPCNWSSTRFVPPC